MDDDILPPLGPREAEALRRQRRAKNLALLVGLCALALLLYLISMAKMKT